MLWLKDVQKHRELLTTETLTVNLWIIKRAEEEQPHSSVSLITDSPTFTHTVKTGSWQLQLISYVKRTELVIQHSPHKPQFGNLIKPTLAAHTWLWTLLNEGLSTQQQCMKPGQHRRQQSPGIMVRGAKILKRLTESLTQHSLKSLTAEQHPGDAQLFDVLKNTFKCALCCQKVEGLSLLVFTWALLISQHLSLACT